MTRTRLRWGAFVLSAMLLIPLLLFLLTGDAAPPDGAAAAASDSLHVRFIGNEGVSLSDGATTLLTDLPYVSGAFGYMHYRPEQLRPEGPVVSVVTHRHDDHFSPALFRERDWQIVGPEEVTAALPAARVLSLRDTVAVGAFRIVPLRTPHSDTEHYSYLITWRGVRLYFVGDTEDPTRLLATPDLDVVFITSWLSCTVEARGATVDAARLILYHQRADGSDRVCGAVEELGQGAGFWLEARDG